MNKTIQLIQNRNNIKRISNKYKSLLYEYKDLVKKHKRNNVLEVELQKYEHDLLANPPLSEEVNKYGQKTGLLKPKQRGLIMGPNKLSIPKARPLSEYKLISISEWDKYIEDQERVDLRKFVPKGMILDQDGVKSCASESIAGSIMAVRVFNGMKPVKLNPLFAYHTVSGGRDGGSTLSDNVSFAEQYGIASQDVWPRSNGWRAKPSEEAYEDAKNYRLLEFYKVSSWEEFGTALLLGWPVYFGYSGHAIWGTKVISTSRLEYCNSWGEEFGDDGFGTLAKNSIMWGYGAYAIRVVTHS